MLTASSPAAASVGLLWIVGGAVWGMITEGWGPVSALYFAVGMLNCMPIAALIACWLLGAPSAPSISPWVC